MFAEAKAFHVEFLCANEPPANGLTLLFFSVIQKPKFFGNEIKSFADGLHGDASLPSLADPWALNIQESKPAGRIYLSPLLKKNSIDLSSRMILQPPSG
jgi:hypothetical protein